AIGKAAADEGREQAANAVSANGNSGVGGFEPEPGHVDSEERQNERAEFVKKGAEEKNPGAAWQCTQVAPQPGRRGRGIEAGFAFAHKLFCFAHKPYGK